MKHQVELQPLMNLKKINIILMWWPLTNHIFIEKIHRINWERWWKIQRRIIYELMHDSFFENANYFISDFLKQCKQNENDLPFLFKYTKNIIKKILSKSDCIHMLVWFDVIFWRTRSRRNIWLNTKTRRTIVKWRLKMNI